jgi:spermidine/putrescine ABC transporter ATP-binding subunit
MNVAAKMAMETSRSAGAVVTLSSLKKQFGGVGAVDDVSLDIAGGEFLTLLGPSGSGKSTTLMMIAGFEVPDGGDIAIDGRSVVELSPHRRNIGMVFQNYALFPHLTVADNIGFPLKQRRIGRAERSQMVQEVLELVRLPGYGSRYPRQLSGGQQQRVALARAMVFRPRLLLMDEPLGALDKQLRESLQLEMRRLHAELGITFIYVTHDQEEALTMSDRIAVMNEGRIAQLGRPEELYDRPTSRFVASFLGESNFLPGIVQGVQGNTVVAQCGGRMVHAVASHRPEKGAHVMLTMRPERMRFADEPERMRFSDEPERMRFADDAERMRFAGDAERMRLGDESERMRFAAGSALAVVNRIPATVTEAVFAGERCRYLLRAEDGTPMVLKEPSGSAVRRRQVGETTEVAWPAADTVIV